MWLLRVKWPYTREVAAARALQIPTSQRRFEEVMRDVNARAVPGADRA